jgi:hypothetical protein
VGPERERRMEKKNKHKILDRTHASHNYCYDRDISALLSIISTDQYSFSVFYYRRRGKHRRRSRTSNVSKLRGLDWHVSSWFTALLEPSREK